MKGKRLTQGSSAKRHYWVARIARNAVGLTEADINHLNRSLSSGQL